MKLELVLNDHIDLRPVGGTPEPERDRLLDADKSSAESVTTAVSMMDGHGYLHDVQGSRMPTG